MRFRHPLLARLARLGVVLATLYAVLIVASVVWPVNPTQPWAGRRVADEASKRPPADAARHLAQVELYGLSHYAGGAAAWLLSAAVLRQTATGRVRWSGAAWLPGAGALGLWAGLLWLGLAAAEWAAPHQYPALPAPLDLNQPWVGKRVADWVRRTDLRSDDPRQQPLDDFRQSLHGLSGGRTEGVRATDVAGRPARLLAAARLEGSMLLSAVQWPAVLLGLAGTVHCLRPPGNEP